MASLPSVPKIKLGSQGLEVSAQGLGCFGMTGGYGPPKPEQEMIELVHHSVACGVTFFDTADLYGPYTNEVLLGKAIKGIREKVQVATKFGFCRIGPQKIEVRGDPEYVRACCEASLKRLDVDCIDLYYQHRPDTRVPIEITVGEMKKLVEEGKVKYLGLSEASASNIRRAHAVHPISAVQLEWSVWLRDVEEEIIPTCRELGIGIVPYGALARGFFSVGAKVLENLASDDFRKLRDPRLQGENLERNKAIFENLERVAARKGCRAGQVALAWLQHKGEDVAPIPGTTKVKNLEENVGALAVKLSKEDLDLMDALFPPGVVSGDRYTKEFECFKYPDTPPLTSWSVSPLASSKLPFGGS